MSVARQLRRALVESLDQHEAAEPPMQREAAITTNDVGPRYNGPWMVAQPVPPPVLAVPVRYYQVPPPAW